MMILRKISLSTITIYLLLRHEGVKQLRFSENPGVRGADLNLERISGWTISPPIYCFATKEWSSFDFPRTPASAV